MLVFCNRKLKRINKKGKILWSINFKAPGWGFLAGLFTALIIVSIQLLIGVIEMC